MTDMISGKLIAESAEEQAFLEARLKERYPEVAVSCEMLTTPAGAEVDICRSALPEGSDESEQELQEFNTFLHDARDEWNVKRVARLLGHRGGRSCSPKKVAAAKENGKKGGRPKTNPKPEPEWDGARPGDELLLKDTAWKLFGAVFLAKPSMRPDDFMSDAQIAERNSKQSKKLAATLANKQLKPENEWDPPSSEELKKTPRYERLRQMWLKIYGPYARGYERLAREEERTKD